MLVSLVAERARCRRQGGEVGLAGEGEALFGRGAHACQGSRQNCLGRLSHPHSGGPLFDPGRYSIVQYDSLVRHNPLERP